MKFQETNCSTPEHNTLNNLKMRNFGMLLALFCLVYSSLPIQAMEDNNDLLEYGNYLYTDSGSGMEIEQENCTSTQLIEIPIDDNCYKKNGELIIVLDR